MGRAYKEKGEYDTTISLYLEALEIIEKVKGKEAC